MTANETLGPERDLLRLGTRRSALALAQSGMVARALEARHAGLRVTLVPRTTEGDRLPGDLGAAGGKGLFTRELERGLLDGSLDLAVHSLKDLPVALPPGLAVAAYPEREDPRDVLVSEVAADLDGLPEGAVVLTGALRRRAQILLRRPDLRIEPLRGNVDTRLEKWRASGAAALVLAGAGLARLGWLAAGAGAQAGPGRRRLPIHLLAPEVLLPAPGQGTLALEVRAGAAAERLCGALDHAPTAAAAQAERLVVAAFGGDCTLPLAAWARWEDETAQSSGGASGFVPGGVAGPAPGSASSSVPSSARPCRLRLTALLATPDGRHVARGEAIGNEACEVAAACVAALRRNGADEVLARIRG
ncbi:MAG TPA: hydroxymethylbilane synthase [Thermoanaerobaculia bacterium]|nr:hydroxymethylbilane synthase [Thermoanaerobaculia bacterium]